MEEFSYFYIILYVANIRKINDVLSKSLDFLIIYRSTPYNGIFVIFFCWWYGNIE